jgi:hypothetical protein
VSITLPLRPLERCLNCYGQLKEVTISVGDKRPDEAVFTSECPDCHMIKTRVESLKPPLQVEENP